MRDCLKERVHNGSHNKHISHIQMDFFSDRKDNILSFLSLFNEATFDVEANPYTYK